MAELHELRELQAAYRHELEKLAVLDEGDAERAAQSALVDELHDRRRRHAYEVTKVLRSPLQLRMPPYHDALAIAEALELTIPQLFEATRYCDLM